MKKNSFIDGAIIATVSLVICKILGLLYVIPFYKIIGTRGGALYSYAYSIYAVFLNLSTIGIPSAVAKIISEYDALDYQSLKHRGFKLASKLLNYIGLFSFLVLFFFSNFIAESIIGGVEGGNTVSNVSIAIKIVSLALLIVPRLSILKGYFQGNKFISPPSYSAIIEQLVRVIIIIVGSYIVVNVLNMSVDCAVYTAIFGATVGALTSYLFLKIKFKKNLNYDENNIVVKTEEKKITNKQLIGKIIVYALPFVAISMLQSAYNVIDTFTVVKTLTSLGYSASVAETVIGVVSTWGSKLNMIVVSISIGMTSSLIPNIAGSYAKKDFKNINNIINLSFKMLIYVTLPMTLGISFLGGPIWHVFYGVNSLSTSIFKVYILQVIFYGLYNTLITITQSMNQTKITIGSLIASFLLKLILNVPSMYLFKYLGLPAYYAPIVTDILIQFSVFMVTLLILSRKFKFSYKKLIPFICKVCISLVAMLIGLFLLKLVYFNDDSILLAIITISLFSIVGVIIYFVVSSRFKLLEQIFGKNYINKMLKKLKIKCSK